jgi:alkylation response protein AidB-like acyl-CoA dehydrogenase
MSTRSSLAHLCSAGEQNGSLTVYSGPRYRIGMDLSFTPEEERYRARVREFIEDNLPQGWGTPGHEMPTGRALVELLRQWQRRMLKHGFVAMAWPREYGGQGASAVQMAIFNEECAQGARAGAAQWGGDLTGRSDHHSARRGPAKAGLWFLRF